MIVVASMLHDAYAGLSQLAQDSAPLVPSVILGFLGIYLLLPRVRGSRPVLGAGCAGLALLLLGGQAAAIEVVLPEKILFFAFSGIAIAAGAMMISQKNPVHAALSFALVVLSTCGLFLLQAAPFLMAATIIIYAGAIVVTFLFVIMLAQQAGVSGADQRSREPFLASLAGFVLIGALFCTLHRNYDTQELDKLLAEVRQVAQANSADEVIAILGDPSKRSPRDLTHPLVTGLSKYFPGEDAVANLEVDWQEIRQPTRLHKLQANSRLILALAPERRVSQGILTPAKSLPLSKLSGMAANERPTPTEDGKMPERLPAYNVAGLGTALFTDYLVPVELAAMLLLVATIGAIAIAGRRTEGLR
jgi:NADH-quinone oxidoreductase subunit J